MANSHISTKTEQREQSCEQTWAFRAIASYAGGNTRAWVLAIVRNTAYTWLRKNRRLEEVPVDDLEVSDRAQPERGGDIDELISASSEAEFIAKSDEACLRTAIANLSPEFREVLVVPTANPKQLTDGRESVDSSLDVALVHLDWAVPIAGRAQRARCGVPFCNPNSHTDRQPRQWPLLPTVH